VNLLKKRRGVSGIISGVFLVAVAVMVFNVLAWQFFQYDAYRQIVLEQDQREWERFNERLAVLEIVAGVQYLNFTVRNYGSVSSHIVTLYFEFINGTKSVHTLNVWISPGTTKRIVNVGPKLTTTDKYDFMIATERGNTFRPSEGQYVSNEIRPGQGQAMPFIFGFGYSDFQYSLSGPPYNWLPAWRPQAGSQPYFRIFLNNTYSQGVIVLAPDTRMAFVLDDFQSSNKRMSYLISSTTVPANSGLYLYFTQLDKSFGGAGSHYYVFVEIFYKFVDSSEIYGTTVGVLAVYTI